MDVAAVRKLGVGLGCLVAAFAFATPARAEAGALAAAPASLEFGDVVVGSTKTLSVVVTNGSSTPVFIDGRGTGGVGQFFLGATDNCFAHTIPAGGSCTTSVDAKPTTLGDKSGTLTLSYDSASHTLAIPLHATAVGKLVAQPEV